MTGITADIDRLSTAATHAVQVADRLRIASSSAGDSHPPSFLPAGIDRLAIALTTARRRHQESALTFAEFYDGAGASLDSLRTSLTLSEGATVHQFHNLAGT